MSLLHHNEKKQPYLLTEKHSYIYIYMAKTQRMYYIRIIVQGWLRHIYVTFNRVGLLGFFLKLAKFQIGST